jgi:hypothetical protein
MTRVIVTGSQGWDDEGRVRRVLTALWGRVPGATLVSGGCPRGADALAERAWRRLGGPVETHRPKWRPGGVFDPAAGFRRSEVMVRLGAVVCVAFIVPCGKPGCAGKPADRRLSFHGTHGSVHCADYAEDSGMKVRRVVPILAA